MVYFIGVPPLNVDIGCGTITSKGGDIVTRDTEKALIIIYCQYKKRLDLGTNEEAARYFEDAKLRSIENFSDWDYSKLKLSIQQLQRKGYIFVNIWDDVRLLDGGIEYIESKPKEYFDSFISAISGIASIIGALFSV